MTNGVKFPIMPGVTHIKQSKLTTFTPIYTENIMITTEHPITRSELRQELQHYATKEDLAKLETRLIKWIVGQMIAAIVAASAVAVVIQQVLD